MFSKVDNIGAERMYSECPVGDCFCLQNDLYCVSWGVKQQVHVLIREASFSGPTTIWNNNYLFITTNDSNI